MEVINFTETLKKIDINQIVDLENVISNNFKNIYKDVWNKQNFEKSLSKKSSFSFFVIDDIKLIGFSIAYECGNEWAHISKVAVNPQFTNRGIAKKMMLKQINYIFNESISRITIETSVDNKSALKLFQKVGFTILKNDELEEYIKIKNRPKSFYIGNEKTHCALILRNI